jgi:hypothetical protein
MIFLNQLLVFGECFSIISKVGIEVKDRRSNAASQLHLPLML